MAFDLSSAKPVAKPKPKFDISSAKAVRQPPVLQQPVDYQFGQTASNFLPSLGKALSDTASAVVNYDDTIEAISNLVASGMANAAQELHDALPESVQSEYPKYLSPNLYEAMGFDKSEDRNYKDHKIPNQKAGEDFVGYLDDRYGSLDAVKRTAMEDPAGMLLDVSGLITGGGTAAAKMGGTVGKVGQKAQSVGAALDPMTGVVRAPTAAVEAVLGQPLSHKLYGSAMKPSTTLDINPRKNVIAAGLELGALPTIRSTERLNRLRKDVGGQLDTALNSADDLGRVIEGESLLAEIGKVRDEFAPPKPSSLNALPDIDDVVENIREAVFLNGGRKLTVREVNDIKTDLYRSINWDKAQKIGGNAKTMSDATERAMKQVADTSRRIVANYAPDVVPLNDAYGKIVDVQRSLQQQGANRIQNKDLLGIGAPIQIATGQALGGNVGGLAATAAAVADRALPKAAIAVGVNRVGKAVRNPNVTGALASASLAGRYEEAALAEHDKTIENEMANGAIK